MKAYTLLFVCCVFVFQSCDLKSTQCVRVKSVPNTEYFCKFFLILNCTRLLHSKKKTKQKKRSENGYIQDLLLPFAKICFCVTVMWCNHTANSGQRYQPKQ